VDAPERLDQKLRRHGLLLPGILSIPQINIIVPLLPLLLSVASRWIQFDCLAWFSVPSFSSYAISPLITAKRDMEDGMGTVRG
jgi:hypothetical protein